VPIFRGYACTKADKHSGWLLLPLAYGSQLHSQLPDAYFPEKHTSAGVSIETERGPTGQSMKARCLLMPYTDLNRILKQMLEKEKLNLGAANWPSTARRFMAGAVADSEN
jgi:hypothetical protein